MPSTLQQQQTIILPPILVPIPVMLQNDMPPPSEVAVCLQKGSETVAAGILVNRGGKHIKSRGMAVLCRCIAISTTSARIPVNIRTAAIDEPCTIISEDGIPFRLLIQILPSFFHELGKIVKFVSYPVMMII